MTDQQRSPKSPSEHAAALAHKLHERGDIVDPRVKAAFAGVRRDQFLPGIPIDQVYADNAIPIKRDSDGSVISSSSQPSMMAHMLRQLDLRPRHNVLEIGTGSGYNAAIMQHIVGAAGRVTTVEYDLDLAENARANLQRAAMGQVLVVHGDGAVGYPQRAPYDRLIVTASVWDISPAWIRQMIRDGIIVAPIWLAGFQVSAAFHLERDGSLYSQDNMVCGFVGLRGDMAGPMVTYRLKAATKGDIYFNSSRMIDVAALRVLISDDASDMYLGGGLSLRDYWAAFVPYLMLNAPDTFIFAYYWVDGDAAPYGISGSGFTLIGAASAVFVPLEGEGKARCFGGSDALLAAQDALTAWDAAGRPRQDKLRMRLLSLSNAPAADSVPGKIFRRRDHVLHAWTE